MILFCFSILSKLFSKGTTFFYLSIQDAQGSKTSLISKEGGTPRKKGAKKKKKVKKENPEDEYGESPWAEDLKTLEEDIISGDGQEAEAEEEEQEDKEATQRPEGTKKGPLPFLTAPVLRSQPLDKIFIETSSECCNESIAVEMGFHKADAHLLTISLQANKK